MDEDKLNKKIKKIEKTANKHISDEDKLSEAKTIIEPYSEALSHNEINEFAAKLFSEIQNRGLFSGKNSLLDHYRSNILNVKILRQLDQMDVYLKILNQEIFGGSIEQYISEISERHKIKFNQNVRDELDPLMNNAIGLFYTFSYAKERPYLISELVGVFKKLNAFDFSKARKYVNLTLEDIEQFESATFYGKGGHVSLPVTMNVKEAMINEYNGGMGKLITIANSFGIAEKKAREIVLCASPKGIVKTTLLHVFLPQAYEIVSKAVTDPKSRRYNKQRVCSFLFESFMPIVAEFHDPEEFVLARKHSVLDHKSYKKYQKDSILKYVKK